MKKLISIVFVLIICLVLVSCRLNDTSNIYPTDIRTDAFCIIGFSNSAISQSPVITSDKENIGDVYICIVDENTTPIGSTVTISPGQSIVLDASDVIGSYTIQGKAVNTSGMYTFEIDHSER